MRPEDKALCRYFVCLNIKSQTTSSIYTNMQKIMRKQNEEGKSVFYYQVFIMERGVRDFPTVLKSVLACIEVDSESLPTRFGPSE